jgi:hypothetical protein
MLEKVQDYVNAKYPGRSAADILHEQILPPICTFIIRSKDALDYMSSRINASDIIFYTMDVDSRFDQYHSLTPSRELCSSVTDPKERLWDLYKLYRNEDVTHAVTLTLWFTLNRVVHVHRFELDNIHFSDIYGFVSMLNANV